MHKKLINVILPRKIELMPQTLDKQKDPPEEDFIIRNFIKYKEFDKIKRGKFLDISKNYEKFLTDQKKKIKSYEIFGQSEADKNKVKLIKKNCE